MVVCAILSVAAYIIGLAGLGMWAEQDGYYLNLEGRLQKAHRGLTPPPEVWPNTKALEAIAARAGFSLYADWKKGLKV